MVIRLSENIQTITKAAIVAAQMYDVGNLIYDFLKNVNLTRNFKDNYHRESRKSNKSFF